MENKIDSCKNCIVGWKSFRQLSAQEIDIVNQNRFEAVFKPGEIILKQDSPVSNVLFLSEGLAKVYIEGIGDRNFIMRIVKPGVMILGPGAFTNMRHSFSVSALTRVRACFISFDVIRHLVHTNGAFAELMMEDISETSLKCNNRVVNLAHKKMPGRLAAVLIFFADEIFESLEFNILLSRQELGEMANMAKESVVRILKEFSDSGIIEYNGSKIKILNMQKLTMMFEKG